MPRSGPKPKKAKKKSARAEKNSTSVAKASVAAVPLELEDLRSANDVRRRLRHTPDAPSIIRSCANCWLLPMWRCFQRCLWLINVVVILCGIGLGVTAVTTSSSGSTLGTSWSSGLAGVAVGLVVSGYIGMWLAQKGFSEIDLISTLYFALMVCLMMVSIWLSFFMTFNIDEVKWLTKAWIYTNWAEFWASLSSDEQAHLQETGGCSAEGHAMSALNDDCWEALKQSIFHSWKAAGLIAVLMAVLLPFNIFFAGTKIGWKSAMDSVQSVISFVSIANGVAFLVLAFHVEGTVVVGCVLAGFGVIGLAIIQLVPNLFRDKLGEDFEEHAGKPLFFIYSGLTAASVVGGIYLIANNSAFELTKAIGASELVSALWRCLYVLLSRPPLLLLHVIIVSSLLGDFVCRLDQGASLERTMRDEGLQAVGSQINHEFTTADLVGLAGWALLLVGEFLALQALCNLVDWLTPGQPSSKRGRREKREKGTRKKSARGRRKEEYAEVDDDEANDDDDEDENGSDDEQGDSGSGDESDSENGRGRRRKRGV